MSGPKISNYELARRRREQEAARLEAERKRIEAERRIERERIEEEIKLEQKLISEQSDCLEHFAAIAALDSAAPAVIAIRKKYNELNELMTEAEKSIVFVDNEEGQRQLSKLKSTKAKKETLIKSLRSDVSDWEGEAEKKMAALTDTLFVKDHTPKKKEVPAEPLQEEDKKSKEEAEAILETLNAEYAGERITEVIKNLLALEDYRQAIDYYRKNKSKLEEIASKRQAEQQARQEALIAYYAACELVGSVPKEIPANMEGGAMVNWLTKERIELEVDFLAKREKEIIREELESVMEELGYNVIATKSTTTKRGKTINERVFSFGDGSAINIIEAGGQITMEVVGLDTSDRAPSEEESEYLEDEMGAFCEKHAEIEKKLEARGVVLKNRIQMNPPSKAYAQILNLSQYEQTVSHVSMIQNIAHSKKKRQGKEEQKYGQN